MKGTAEIRDEQSRLTAENQSKMTVEKGSPFPNKQVYQNSNKVTDEKIKILDDQDFENLAEDVRDDYRCQDIYYDDPKMHTLKSDDLEDCLTPRPDPNSPPLSPPRFFGQIIKNLRGISSPVTELLEQTPYQESEQQFASFYA